MSLNLKKISGKCICFFILFFLVCFISYPVKAGVITNSTQKKQLFAVPGGGWSTITVEVHYNENYTASGSNNKFTGRSKTVFFNRAYTTSCPVCSLDNVKHSNGTVFSNWTKGQLYVDTSKWENGSTYDNTTSVTYSATTSNTGTLSFMLSCSGGMPASSADSVRLNLNTK